MAATVSKGLKDCTHLKVVPVIATYDGNGNILPLYVRIGEETFKIYNAYVSESTYRILTFKGEVNHPLLADKDIRSSISP